MTLPARTALAQEVVAPDEAATIAAFITFLRAASAARHPTGRVRRFNQARHAGCVEAEFTVLDGLPAQCRIGLFAESRTYVAWIRFASASSSTDREKDVRGMSIKLRDVGGENLTPGCREQDFILNSHPVMPVAGPREFLPLLQAMEAGSLRRAWYFLSHPGAARIGWAARQQPTSHLDIPYWSTTPYLFGPGRAVKYSVRPTSDRRSPLADPLTDDYLRRDLAARLLPHTGGSSSDQAPGQNATFDVLIQWQADAATMPIEDASVEWSERVSPPVAVARIRIAPQRIDTPDRERACEDVAFNPWHCLTDHRPLGGFNRARREIYRTMAEVRAASDRR
jgi:hypothetical protein